MPTPRLAKLTRPRTDGLVARPRLFEMLDAACARPVVWIAGPPGAGKTSLVSSYLDARARPCLWYQVDGGDADPATFFYYLGIAAETSAGRKRKALPLFTEEYAADLEGFSRRFFRSLFEQWDDGWVLVLDNYQEAGDGEAFHACVRIAVEELPARGHGLFGISRAEPPAALSRARASQQLSVIGWEQLKLTTEETAAIAAEAGPSADVLAQLVEQSGGWAAGVVLMLERLRQTGGFRAGNAQENLETIFEYFAGQVFEGAPKDTRDMLVRLAYLPRMTAATSEAVTGNPAAGKLLATLARRNLFTDRRYGDETSYQFHALFRAFLKERAREQLGLAEHQRLAHSVAALLQATGQIEDALHLYVESGAWDAAARLVVHEIESMVRQGRRETLRRWIEALPLDVVNRDPALLHGLGLSHFRSGVDNVDAARGLLTRAFEGFERAGDVAGQLLSASAMAESYYSDPAGMAPLDPWITRLQALLDGDTTELPPDLRARALLNLSRSLFYLRPLDCSVADAAQRLRACLDLDDVSADACVLGRGFLLMHGWWRTDVPGNSAVIEATDPLLDRPGVGVTSRLNYLFYKANHFVGAHQQPAALLVIEQALEISDESGLSPLSYDFHRLAALALFYLRQYREAYDRMVRDVMPNVSRQRASQRVFAHSTMALLELAMGNREPARGHIEALDREMGGRVPLAEWLLMPILAGLWASFGEFDRALRILDKLEARPDVMTDTPLLFGRTSLYRAFVYHLQGRRSDAVDVLRRSLPRLARMSYTVWVCHPHDRFTMLLALALEHGIETDFVTGLIRTYDIPAPDPDLDHWPWPLRLKLLGRYGIEGIPAGKSGKSRHRLNELLRAIAVRGPDGVSLRALADNFWPDSEGDAAFNSAQVSLYRLRKLLGREDTIRVHDGIASIDRTVCWVDAWAFESKARRAMAEKDDLAKFEPLARRALGLYTGHLLEEESDAAWTLTARQRLRRQWTELVLSLGNALERAGRADESADLYEHALDRDPEAEVLYRHLLLCCQGLGQTTRATAAYERCRKILAERQGSEPSAELRQIHRSITAGKG